MVRYQPASKRGRNIGSSRFQAPDLCTGGTTSGLSTIAPKTSRRDSEKTDKTNRASRPSMPNLPEVAETTEKAPGSGSALGDRREPANLTHLLDCCDSASGTITFSVEPFGRAPLDRKILGR